MDAAGRPSGSRRGRPSAVRCGRARRAKGFSSTRSRLVTRPLSGSISMTQMRLAGNAAGHGRADAGRDRRVEEVDVEADMQHAVGGRAPAPGRRRAAARCRARRWRACRARHDACASSAARSAGSTLRRPIMQMLRGVDAAPRSAGKKPCEARSPRGIGHGNAMQIAAGGGVERVEVRVRVEPQHEQRTPQPPPLGAPGRQPCRPPPHGRRRTVRGCRPRMPRKQPPPARPPRRRRPRGAGWRGCRTQRPAAPRAGRRPSRLQGARRPAMRPGRRRRATPRDRRRIRAAQRLRASAHRSGYAASGSCCTLLVRSGECPRPAGGQKPT